MTGLTLLTEVTGMTRVAGMTRVTGNTLTGVTGVAPVTANALTGATALAGPAFFDPCLSLSKESMGSIRSTGSITSMNARACRPRQEDIRA